MATIVENQGVIKVIRLADEWREASSPDEQDSNVLRRERIFRPQSSSRAEIVFYDRGIRISEPGGEAFDAVLQEEPHALDRDELSRIAVALGDLAEEESFKLTAAATRDLNGKTALDVRGIWQYDQRRYHGLLLSADLTGQLVQQIYLMSPPDEFERYDRALEEALHSIEWKS